MPLQATSGAASYDAFGGGVPVEPNYIESVFSTFLYTGNGSTQTINNGIDLAGEGGLVWEKNRSVSQDHYLVDSNRPLNDVLRTNTTGTPSSPWGGYSFGANGYTSGINFSSGHNIVSWTFRKQPKFFDVVTYTGNGVAGREIPHSLGSVPGCVIVKRTDFSTSWRVQHRSLNTAGGQDLILNSTLAAVTNGDVWNSTPAGAASFTVGIDTDSNANGGTFVAYLFAHNAGGFGLTGTDNVISCGSFTTDGSGNATVNLGYEPQWVLVKNTQTSGTSWVMLDNMRGWTMGNDSALLANLSNAENTGDNYGNPTATGFYINNNGGTWAASNTHIYIAIRRGPMKVPESGTSVFAPLSEGGTGAARTVDAGFPVDTFFIKDRTGLTGPTDGGNVFYDRLRGNSNVLQTQSTAAEAVSGTYTALFNSTQNGVVVGSAWSSYGYREYCFRRAPGFFDEVCYTGTGGTQTLTHNLGVSPELSIFKSRSGTSDWTVYYGGSLFLRLNLTSAGINDPSISPTATTVNASSSLGSGFNTAGVNYVSYLFASCPGVSKVGSYTGNGSTQTINCGFAAGARFVMVKRTDSTGNWMVVDTARGLVSAGDPTLYLNSTAAEVTGVDWLDPDSSGFIVNQEGTMNANVNAATYIFLAIA